MAYAPPPQMMYAPQYAPPPPPPQMMMMPQEEQGMSSTKKLALAFGIGAVVYILYQRSLAADDTSKKTDDGDEKKSPPTEGDDENKAPIHAPISKWYKQAQWFIPGESIQTPDAWKSGDIWESEMTREEAEEFVSENAGTTNVTGFRRKIPLSQDGALILAPTQHFAAAASAIGYINEDWCSYSVSPIIVPPELKMNTKAQWFVTGESIEVPGAYKSGALWQTEMSLAQARVIVSQNLDTITGFRRKVPLGSDGRTVRADTQFFSAEPSEIGYYNADWCTYSVTPILEPPEVKLNRKSNWWIDGESIEYPGAWKSGPFWEAELQLRQATDFLARDNQKTGVTGFRRNVNVTADGPGVKAATQFFKADPKAIGYEKSSWSTYSIDSIKMPEDVKLNSKDNWWLQGESVEVPGAYKGQGVFWQTEMTLKQARDIVSRNLETISGFRRNIKASFDAPQTVAETQFFKASPADVGYYHSSWSTYSTSPILLPTELKFEKKDSWWLQGESIEVPGSWKSGPFWEVFMTLRDAKDYVSRNSQTTGITGFRRAIKASQDTLDTKVATQFFKADATEVGYAHSSGWSTWSVYPILDAVAAKGKSIFQWW